MKRLALIVTMMAAPAFAQPEANEGYCIGVAPEDCYYAWTQNQGRWTYWGVPIQRPAEAPIPPESRAGLPPPRPIAPIRRYSIISHFATLRSRPRPPHTAVMAKHNETPITIPADEAAYACGVRDAVHQSREMFATFADDPDLAAAYEAGRNFVDGYVAGVLESARQQAPDDACSDDIQQSATVRKQGRLN